MTTRPCARNMTHADDEWAQAALCCANEHNALDAAIPCGHPLSNTSVQACVFLIHSVPALAGEPHDRQENAGLHRRRANVCPAPRTGPHLRLDARRAFHRADDGEGSGIGVFPGATVRGPRPSLRNVSTTVLVELHGAIAADRLPIPISRASLLACGIRHHLVDIESVFAGQTKEACLMILQVAMTERGERTLLPELVWSGPEGAGSTARDTAVVLRSLFEDARHSVILAGYRFDHVVEILEPLHRTMARNEQLQTLFFVDVPQVEGNVLPQLHVDRYLARFFETSWPFGKPYPRIFFDVRALVPGPPYYSLQPKCVIVDMVKAYVSSANFTQPGHGRNFEVGVMIEEPTFARSFGGQWLGLTKTGLVQEYEVE